jgi:hypothetical protein
VIVTDSALLVVFSESITGNPSWIKRFVVVYGDCDPFSQFHYYIDDFRNSTTKPRAYSLIIRTLDILHPSHFPLLCMCTSISTTQACMP